MRFMSRVLTAYPILAFLALLLIGGQAGAVPANVAELMRFEQQYMNSAIDRTLLAAIENNQLKKYSPQSEAIFAIKSYWLPMEKFQIAGVDDASNLLGIEVKRTNKNGEKQVLFLVHPESEDIYSSLVGNSEMGPKFMATATSSSRTLLVWPEQNPEKVFFGKLSLNKEISSVVRTIPKGEVARSVGTTLILQAERYLPKDFLYFPEVFGVMPKGWGRGGMILRSIPKEIQQGELRLIPLFALYTKGKQKESPIIEMIRKSGMRSDLFIIEKIIRPFVKQWVDLAVNQGIAIEAHAQNVLMEVDASGIITGKFIYRDFGGFNIDLNFRRSHNLSVPQLPVFESEIKDYHQEHHQTAIVQSLERFFEGGFLFGLGKELEYEGFSYLEYSGLKNILRDQLKNVLKLNRVEVDDTDFFARVFESVKKARSKVKSVSQCNYLF